ncbi:hypothetical protein F4604DRAFT_1682290 [Suillus subluteus]|nr:hypothetical protein F4604DRAFT_1682290 [Suillus subluteus]
MTDGTMTTMKQSKDGIIGHLNEPTESEGKRWGKGDSTKAQKADNTTVMVVPGSQYDHPSGQESEGTAKKKYKSLLLHAVSSSIWFVQVQWDAGIVWMVLSVEVACLSWDS